jgi:lysozyme family protein
LLQKLGLTGGAAAAQPAHASHQFNVEWVQESLNHLIGANLEVDGHIGPATTAAVEKYQKSKKLDPDGWIGMLTLAELEKDMDAKSNPRSR